VIKDTGRKKELDATLPQEEGGEGSFHLVTTGGSGKPFLKKEKRTGLTIRDEKGRWKEWLIDFTNKKAGEETRIKKGIQTSASYPF